MSRIASPHAVLPSLSPLLRPPAPCACDAHAFIVWHAHLTRIIQSRPHPSCAQDFTPWFSVPPALRGITPITKEPWLRDLNIYMEYEEARRQGRAEYSLMYQQHEALPSSEQAAVPQLLHQGGYFEKGLDASGGLAGGRAPKGSKQSKQRQRPGEGGLQLLLTVGEEVVSAPGSAAREPPATETPTAQATPTEAPTAQAIPTEADVGGGAR